MIQQRTLPGRKDGPSSGSLALIISLIIQTNAKAWHCSTLI